jgi:hypothetical protein
MDVGGELRYSKLHVFRYSARPDTAAAEMPDEIPPDVKKDRSKRLIDLGNEIRERFLADHLTSPLQVLVEDERVIDGVSVCSGQTDDYVRVWFEGSGLLGEFRRDPGPSHGTGCVFRRTKVAHGAVISPPRDLSDNSASKVQISWGDRRKIGTGGRCG